MDLTLHRSAPLIADTLSPMDEGITGKERKRRTIALRAAAQAYVVNIALPALSQAVGDALGTAEGWSIELDPDENDRQTLLFHYPAAIEGVASGYIEPRIKLEYGARGGGASTNAWWRRDLIDVAEQRLLRACPMASPAHASYGQAALLY